ncbi:MAG: type II toxin-antitoxin system RelE/ParE family toxin [Thermodesulfovibrionales bacterium]|nr:type II toxin-antitoxin system RelE/ParE family toxin [Thermodesulfovibrionales bacterium]
MYQVIIDELVFKEDFKRIDASDQRKIIIAIRKKLVLEPEKFGSPLKCPLKGYWKLRVGEYRVVYEIEKDRVLVYVIAVGFRRNEEVYRRVLKRLGG